MPRTTDFIDAEENITGRNVIPWLQISLGLRDVPEIKSHGKMTKTSSKNLVNVGAFTSGKPFAMCTRSARKAFSCRD